MSNQTTVPDPISDLVAIFSEHLRDVSFPDVDAKRLQDLAAALEASADTLATAEAALIAAREAHAEAQQELTTAAERGLAYAQVYASDDDVLSAKLAAVPLGQAKRSKPVATGRKKRRSPPKPENLAELPFTGPQAPKKVGAA